MAEFDRPTIAAGAGSAAVVDQGLRSYMLRIYNYMTIGLVVTGVVAYFANAAAVSSVPTEYQFANGISLTPFGAAIYTSPLQWVIMLAPLAFVFALSFGINRMSAGAAQLTFWVFSAVMGLSLSSIFLVYTGQSIARTFFVSAAMFGAMSLYGYTTRRDLSGFGSFLLMGLIGIIIASVVNIWLASSALAFGISILGVLIFVGLTAYDTQRIKASYSESYGADVLAKGAIMGALSLYLDFLNLFLMLLRLTGNQRN
jgi:FtsH-binding integral membrane protein